MSVSEILYLNGEFIKSRDAKVSVFDFGFLYAGGVYEVILVNNGKPYRLEEHLKRLQVSADLIGLNVSVSPLAEVCQELIRLNDKVEGKLYIQATFGDFGERRHVIPSDLEPTLLVTIQSDDSIPEDYFINGVSIKTVPDTRWVHCNIKSIALLPNLLELSKASRDGYQEVVFYEKETGCVTECAASNIFCVSQETLFTPPESSKILSGITRSVILELARKNGIETVEEDFSFDFLMDAEEIFISSTTKEVVPVRSVNQKKLGSVPGKITARLMLLLIEDLECLTGGTHWKRSIL